MNVLPVESCTSSRYVEPGAGIEICCSSVYALGHIPFPLAGGIPGGQNRQAGACCIVWSRPDKGGAKMSCCSNKTDNSSSACALKDILDNLDNLNTQDLCTLKCVIERILCCRG
jgi:hypothetical protein